MADLTGSSSVTYTALTVTGAGLVDRPGDSSLDVFDLETITTTSTVISVAGISGDEESPSVYAPAVEIPMLDVVSGGVGARNATSYEHIPVLDAQGTIEPPTPILAFGATQSIGLAGKTGRSDDDLPAIDAASVGSTARVTVSAAAILVAQSDGTGLCQRLGVSSLATKAFDDASTGYTSRLAESSQPLGMLTPASSGASNGADGSMQWLPMVEFESTGMTSRVGTAVLSLLSMSGEGAGTGSGMSMSEIELPMWTGTGHGGGLAGASILELPAWVVLGAGTNNATVTAGTAAAQGLSYAMHTQSNALVQDTNHRFNSYAAHGSVILAANEDGLFVLGGSTDAGASINSSVVLPVSDLDEPMLKRIAQLTVGYRADGRMLLSLLTDDGNTVSYTMEAVTGAKCQPNRVKVGRGSKSRYWEFQIDNIDGCDHAIDKLDVDWQILSRRVP